MKGNLTIPNLLTVLRILITPAFVVAFVNKDYTLSLFLFFLAGVTDGLDGFIARFFNQKSKLGALLDPLADKVLLMTTYICLGIVKWVPVWLAVLVVSRDLLILGGIGLLSFLGVDIKEQIKPSFLSKINTLVQIVLVLEILGLKSKLWSPFLPLNHLYLGVGIFTFLSGLSYVWRGVSYLFSLNNNVKNGNYR